MYFSIVFYRITGPRRRVLWGYIYTHIVVVYFWSTELEKAQFAAFFLINFLAENPRPYQMVYRPGDMIGKNVQSRGQSMKIN